jgi:hypothetical protein
MTHKSRAFYFMAGDSIDKERIRALYIVYSPIRRFIETMAIAFTIFSLLPDLLHYMDFIEHKSLNYQYGIPFGLALFIADFVWAKKRLKR